MTEGLPAPPWPRPLLLTARFVSWVLHPLFVGVMMMFYITFLQPTLFLAVSPQARVLKFATFVVNNCLFPALVVILSRALGFNSSIHLDSSRERIVPYMASVIFFFWTWNVFRNQPESPELLVSMCLGIFLSACAALVLNSFQKISMHAMGMGGLLGLLWVMAGTRWIPGHWMVAVAVLSTGLVLTARMLVTDHTGRELASGLFVGIAMQLIAAWL